MRTALETRSLWRAGSTAAAVVLATAPLEAQGPELAMLDSLARGAWNLRIRDDGSQRRICVRDGREFIQLRGDYGLVAGNGCSHIDAADRQVGHDVRRGTAFQTADVQRDARKHFVQSVQP